MLTRMSKSRLSGLLLVGALLIMASFKSVSAQQPAVYADPQGRFTAALPAGWEARPAEGHALFEKGGVKLYLMALAVNSPDAGIDAALAQISPGFNAQPVQNTTTPDGVWTMKAYMLADGSLYVAFGQTQSAVTYLIVFQAPSVPAFQAVGADQRPIVEGFRVGSTAAPAPEKVAAAPTVSLPTPTGPYKVGRMAFEWLDEAREDALTEDTSDRRAVIVWVYYPATPAPAAQVGTWLPGKWGELVGQAIGLRLDRLNVHAIPDAPIATDKPGYPVLIFSPGVGVIHASYTSLFEEIASHGYIVAAINHTHEASLTVFSDGRAVSTHPAAQDESMFFGLRLGDMQFAIARLESLNAERFGGKLDFARLGVFGHSEGGKVAAELCRLDSRCKAGINLDGALDDAEVARSGLAQPFMQIFSVLPTCEAMVGAGAPMTLEQCQAAAALYESGWQTLYTSSQAGYRLVIDGARHMSFTDIPFLVAAVPQLEPMLDGATIQAEHLWRITSDYTLAFFGKYLSGTESSLLDGPSADYPEVKFEHHKG